MVNITEVESTASLTDLQKIEKVYNRQRELITKYLDIEEKNGLLYTRDIPVKLDSSKGQARLKQVAWWITEEIGEFIHATDHTHKIEELCDAYHFLIELNILSTFTIHHFRKRLKENVYSGTTPNVVLNNCVFELNKCLITNRLL